MTEQKAEKKNILWAFDPFASEIKLQRAVALAMQELTRTGWATIEPVFVVHNFFGVPKDVVADVSSIQKHAETRLKVILGKAKIANVKPVKIIFEPYLSQRAAVEKLIEYARQSNVDLIVTGSYARTGPKRWLLGSFAETLVLRSDVPFLIVNPHWNRVARFKHVLFPTDFSSESHDSFRRCLGLARALGAQVTIFNRPMLVPAQASELSWMTLLLSQGTLDVEKVAHEKAAATWSGEAEAAGVKTRVVFDKSKGGSVAEAILKYAKKNPGLIAMASHSGAFHTAWLGSVARRVVRESPFPVWVIHPASRG